MQRCRGNAEKNKNLVKTSSFSAFPLRLRASAVDFKIMPACLYLTKRSPNQLKCES